MFHRLSLTVTGVVAVLACAGCETVETTVPIGEPARGEVEAWTGIWQTGDTVVHLRGEPDGVLRAATITWEDDAFTLEQVQAQITALGDRRFALISVDEGRNGDAAETPDAEESQDDAVAEASREERYHFLLIEQPEPDVLVLHGSRAPAFRKAVEAGELNGKIIRNPPLTDDEPGRPRTTILRDKASLEAFLEATPPMRLFDFENAIRLERLQPLPSADDASDDPEDDEVQEGQSDGSGEPSGG